MSNNIFTKPVSLVVGGIGATAALIALAACDPLNEPATEAAKTPVASIERADDSQDYAGEDEGFFSGGSSDSGSYSAPTSEPQTLEDVYIQTLHNEGMYRFSNDELVTSGNIACRIFDAGATPESLSYDLMTGDVVLLSGASNDEQAYVAGAAVGALCPRHSHFFE